MPTMSQLWSRIRSLQREYAPELAVLRLRPLAEDFSDQWAVALADRQPAPKSQPFIQRIGHYGYRFLPFLAFNGYLERCRREKNTPRPLEMLAALLPTIPYDRLREMLRWDIPAPDDSPTDPLAVAGWWNTPS